MHADTASMLMKMSTALGGGEEAAPPSASSGKPPSGVSSADGNHPFGPCERGKNSRIIDVVPLVTGGRDGGLAYQRQTPRKYFCKMIDAGRCP